MQTTVFYITPGPTTVNQGISGDLKVKVKVIQSCRTLCNPMDYRVHGILQARILEWVKPFPSPGDLPNLGIEPRSPILQADSLPAEPQGKPLGWLSGSEFASQCQKCGLDPWVEKIHWGREW